MAHPTRLQTTEFRIHKTDSSMFTKPGCKVFPARTVNSILTIVFVHVLVLFRATAANGVSQYSNTAASPYTLNMSPTKSATTYTSVVARARCQARCNAKFGVKRYGASQEFINVYRPFLCLQEHSICQQCSLPCNVAEGRLRDCQELCKTDVCLDSCQLINAMRLENKQTDFAYLSLEAIQRHPEVFSGRKIILRLTPPIPVCLYSPPLQTDDADGSTIVLKWNVFGSNNQTSSHPVTFVVELKEQKENGSPTEWEVLGYTNFSMFSINKLNPSSQFQFRVSAVADTGVVSTPALTEWIRLPPAVPPPPPQNVSVVKQYIRGYTLRAEVTWSVPNNAGCYFKLYWMTSKRGSFYSRELRESMGFSYELSNLDFDSDYKLEIQTYDRAFQISSEKVTVEFSTPSCLQSTNYNYYSCAPDPPVDLHANISGPYEVNGSIFANVTLTWNPPKHVSWHNTISKYVLSLRKTPDIRFTHLIRPDRRIFTVDGDTTEWTIDVDWDSEYVVNILAESKGGQGGKATLQFITGDGYSKLVSEEYQDSTSDAVKTSNKVYYITVIPTLTLAVISTICAVVYFKLRKSAHHLGAGGSGRREIFNPIYEKPIVPAKEEIKPLLANDKYEIAYSSLTFIDVLGEGAFGKVLKAEFILPAPTESQGSITKTVAVKMLKEHATPEEKRFLLLEINAMKFLGDHPHLVSIIGCVTDVDKPCLVMDYCPLGDLRSYLCQRKRQVQYMTRSSQGVVLTNGSNRTSTADVSAISSDSNSVVSSNSSSAARLSNDTGSQSTNSAETLTQATLLSYARQIAVGMEYLNQHRFIHRDLACRNILMSSHTVVKISDFGLSRDVYETNLYQPTSGRRLPYKWMPPESIFDQIFTIKSDVWSYGILLWEIVTLGGCPYPGIPNKDLFSLLKGGYRLGKPSNCSTDLYNIMLSCWHPHPVDRPSFTQLRMKIEGILETTCSYIDLNT